MKEYKVVPGPMGIIVDEDHQAQAFKAYEDLINAEIGAGWSYHSMESITVTETSDGCLSSSSTSKVYYMLIFEREKEADAFEK